jgi:CheY-like chemotaxis protein
MVRRVLIIEDNNEDFHSIIRALGPSADVTITRSFDGDDALGTLHEQGARVPRKDLPDVILLDLNLPGTDGREVLHEIKNDVSLKSIPIIVLSTSTHPKDIAYCYRNGASAYCLKPVDRVRFDETIHAINDFWFRTVILSNT